MIDQEKVATTGCDVAMHLAKDFTKTRGVHEALFYLRPGEFGSDAFGEYELADGTTFELGAAPPGAHTQYGGIMLAVSKVEAAVERIKAHGSTYYANHGGKKYATWGWCANPDGDPFGVRKRHAGR